MSNFSLSVNQEFSLNLKTKLARKMIINLISEIKSGYIVIEDPLGIIRCGNENDSLKSHLIIKNHEFYSLSFFKGSIGFAIAFMKGYVETNDLTSLLLIMAKNLAIVKKSESSLAGILFTTYQRLLYIFKPNTIKKSKDRILAHYDLSNDLFKLFLDESMSYSSLLFENINDSLEVAAENKIISLLEKINLQPQDNLLEIGTGWGALAITAANRFGSKVTTTTISNKQYQYTSDKINALNLSDKITLLNDDYRKLTGKYNKIVSVEMIEAVGYQYFEDYFKKCSDLLNEDGLFALQCITIKDEEYERAKTEVDFIKKFIFPGGCLPGFRKIITTVTEHTDMSLLYCNDISYDYAVTLKRWRDKFIANKENIVKLGFDDYFIKMWEYYFSYCEAGFINRNIMCLQMVFAKRGYSDPRQNNSIV